MQCAKIRRHAGERTAGNHRDKAPRNVVERYVVISYFRVSILLSFVVSLHSVSPGMLSISSSLYIFLSGTAIISFPVLYLLVFFSPTWSILFVFVSETKVNRMSSKVRGNLTNNSENRNNFPCLWKLSIFWFNGHETILSLKKNGEENLYTGLDTRQ